MYIKKYPKKSKGRPSNQDAYLLRQKEKDGKLYLLAVVCDGMGGLKKGEIASRYIVCTWC